MAVFPELQQWMAQVSLADGMEEERIQGWRRVRRSLLPELARGIGVAEAPMDALWTQARSADTREFLSYLYTESGEFTCYSADDEIDVEHLAGELSGLVSGAALIHAIVHNDAKSLLSRTQRLLAEINAFPTPLPAGFPDSVIGASADGSAPAPEILLASLWRELQRQNARGLGWVRDCTWLLLEGWRRQRGESALGAAAEDKGAGPRLIAARVCPALVYQDSGRGDIGWLHVEALSQGSGECCLDPRFMRFMPLSRRFVNAGRAAWQAAQAGAQRDASLLDVRWRLESALPPEQALEGGSLGAALAVALAQLLRDEPLDRAVALTATIDAQGRFGSVAGVRAKCDAAFSRLDARSQPLIERVVVHPVNGEEARIAARLAGRDPKEAVVTSRALEAYLPYASGILKQMHTLLWGEMQAILRDASQRLSRPITTWEALEACCIPIFLLPEPTHHDTPLPHDSDRAGGRGPRDRGDAPLTQPVRWQSARSHLQRGLVSGPPGYGKTMLLWQEAGAGCLDALQSLENNSAPPAQVRFAVFARAIEVAEYLSNISPDTRDLPDALATLLAARHRLSENMCSFLADALRSGRCLLALDALDETPASLQERLMAALNEFVARWPESRLLLTTRPEKQTPGPWLQGGYQRWQALPFDETQMQAVIRLWFADAPGAGQEFWQRVAGAANLRHVLKSPLLLRLACAVALDRWRTQGALPTWTRRAELYTAFLNDLTLAWTRRVPLPSPAQQALFLLFAADVALRAWLHSYAQSENERASMAEIVNEVCKAYPTLADRHLLDDLCNAGIMIYAGANALAPIVTFAHRTFGEYLAACALARHAEKNGWSSIEARVDKYASLQEWREIILFLAGLLPNPTPLLKLLSDPDKDDMFRNRLALAGECLLEIKLPFRPAAS